MAEGRMLKRSIATNEQLERVSLAADFLFMRCIPFLDVEGRMAGAPGRVRALVCPLRAELTTAVVATALQELADAGLVLWYESEVGQVLAFPTFHRHNPVRERREAPSKLPPPPGFVPESAAPAPDAATPTPGVVRDYSGSNPGELPLKMKRSEEKRSEKISSSSARVRDEDAPDRPDRPTTPRQRTLAAAAGSALAPHELADALEAVSNALPPTADGRDVVLDVLRAAATGPDDPGAFLRSIHLTLRPVGGKAATPEQVAFALDAWLQKRSHTRHAGLVGFLRRAHAEQQPTLAAPKSPNGATSRASRHESAERETFERVMRRPEDPRAQLARLRQQQSSTNGNGTPPLALPARTGS